MNNFSKEKLVGFSEGKISVSLAWISLYDPTKFLFLLLMYYVQFLDDE